MNGWHVTCACGVCSWPKPTEAEAITAWNTRTQAAAEAKAREEGLREALKSLENAACMVGQWRSTIMCRFDGQMDWGQWSSLNDSFDRLEEKRCQARAALSASDGEAGHED